MKSRLILFLTFIVLSHVLFAQLTLKITKVPSNTPTNLEIYIAGNFQGWNPGHPDYLLTDNGDGTFEITISPNPGNLEYKFTRGSWGTVEGNANGGFLPNREYFYNGTQATEELEILSWEDVGGVNSTATDNVQIWDTDFYMPQLDRYRRVWVYLPPDYETSNKNYPVLFMHDGQNCFDAATSFAGEWEVDESLNQLFAEGDYGCIVVAVDNGGIHRIDEYSPWNNPSYGGGEGDLYMDFLINSLKPVIDANFRTLNGREYTGLMGSSMGGLISHYGLIEHQNVFSKAGIFSPAYWIVEDEIQNHTQDTAIDNPIKAYIIVGQGEGVNFVNSVNLMHGTLLSKGLSNDEVFKEVHPDGQHSEWYWAREFPAAYEWLFGDLDLTITKNTSQDKIELFPNPSEGVLQFKNLDLQSQPLLEIVGLNGSIIFEKSRISSDTTNISGLNNGIYVVKIWEGKKVVFSKKWVKK